MRSVLCVFLCAATLLAATIARAEESSHMYVNPDTGEYLPIEHIDPGRAKTLGLATFLGTMTGLICGGLVLIFYWNPSADRNISSVMLISGTTGFAAGLVLGMTLPANAGREDAPASLQINKTASLDFNLPHVTFTTAPKRGGVEKIWSGNIFKMTF